MELGETAEQTAVRETLEETGYRVQIVGRLPDLTYTNQQTGEPILVAMFVAKLAGLTDVSAEEQFKWVDIEAAGDLLYPNLRSTLAAART